MKKNRFIKVGLLAVLMAAATSLQAAGFTVGGIAYNIIKEGEQYVEVTGGGEYTGEIAIPATVSYDNISYTVTQIGEYAFRDCTGLTSVDLPDGLKSIGICAFTGCTGLIRFTGNSISSDNRCYIRNKILMAVAPAGLTTYSLPSDGSIAAIASGAFSGCQELTEITISDCINTFGGGFLAGCNKLVTINCQYATTDRKAIIQDNMLKAVAPSGLTSYSVPENVTAIDVYCFAGCTGLQDVTIGNNVLKIGEGAFQGCTGLSTANIPSSLTVWPRALFKGCTGLTSAVIPETVTSLDGGIFDGCTSLTDITYNAGNAVLSCFDQADMSSIFPSTASTVIIGDKVKTLPSYLFSNCKGLKSITIPDNVTSLGEYLFYSCTDLESISCSANPPMTCQDKTFSGMGDKARIFVPENLLPAYESASGWSSFSNIIISQGSTVSENVLYYTSTDDNIVTPYNVNALDRKIYSNVCQDGQGVIKFYGDLKSIGDNAFCNCHNLKSVRLPSTVTNIGYRAFRYCYNMTDVELDENLDSIGYDAFSECWALEHITLPSGVSFLNDYAFCNCEKMDSVVCLGTTPAKLGGYPFNGSCKNNLRIFVPREAMATYRSSWSAYTDYLNIIPDGKSVTQEINYKSSDGQIVTPVYTVGAKLLSNTYNDGTGTMVFDNEVISISFQGCNTLTSIDLPQSILYLPSYAFNNCTALSGFNLPDSLKRIEEYTFYNCDSIRTVTLSEKISYVGTCAFSDCDKLESIYCMRPEPPGSSWPMFGNLPEDARIYIPVDYIGQYEQTGNWSNYKSHMYAISDKKYEIYYTTSDSAEVNINSSYFNARLLSNQYDTTSGKGVLTFDRPITNIGSYAFQNCTNLTDITIPESVRQIDYCAFNNCQKLICISIPNSVKSIQAHAFDNCIFLETVVLPDSLTSIADYCFYICNSLSGLKIPTSVKSIGSWAFTGCIQLKSLELPESISSIGDNAFRDCDIENIVIPKAVTTIEDYTFTSSRIKSITLHNGITGIGSNAFWNCDHLKSITIPDSIKIIKSNTFYSCDSLTQVNLPECLIEIESNAFTYCGQLETINLPESLQQIDQSAFADAGLTTIQIPKDLLSIGEYAFYNCTSLANVILTAIEPVALLNTEVFAQNHSLRTFRVPAGTAETYKTAYNWTPYASRIFEEGFVSPFIIQYTASDSSLISPKTDMLYKDSLTTVGVYENKYTDGQGLLSMGDTITIIGDRAFSYNHKLTGIRIPEGIQKFGNQVFYYCDSLKEVHLEDEIPPSIGNNVFYGTKSSLEIFVPVSAYETYETSDEWADYASYLVPEGGFNRQDTITYTTSDRKKLEPGNLSNIKANLISHDIDTITGVGTMIFDRPIKSIGAEVFYNNSTLTSIKLPKNLAAIGSQAFWNCNQMKSITLPSKLRTIGYGAFESCYNLDTVICLMETPPALSSSYVFNNNASNRKFLVPEESVSAYETADQWSYYANYIFSITILNGSQYTLRYSTNNSSTIDFNNSDKLFGKAKLFSNCKDETSNEYVLLFDRPVETIGESAFLNKTQLKTVEIPKSVTIISASAFEGCSSLTSVILPDALKSIRAAAFSSCTRLTEITLPENVNGIGINAFYKCTRLTTITCKRTKAASLGENAFEGTGSSLKIWVPLDGIEDYESKWSGYADVIFANTDTCTTIVYTSNSGVVTPAQASAFDGKVISNKSENGNEEEYDDHPRNEIWYTTHSGVVTSPYNTSGFGANIVSNTYNDGKGIITFDGEVTDIPQRGFYRNMDLKTVELPNGITHIYKDGFYDNYNLESITFSKNLEFIGHASFGYNWALTELYFPSTLKTLDQSAFYGCTKVTELYCEATTPPTCNTDALDNYNTNRIIYVPVQSVTAYKSATGWSNYATSIEGYKFPSNAPGYQSLTSGIQSAANNATTDKKYMITFDRLITIIGAQAFKEQKNLVSMTIPEGITQIGVEAYANDSSLTTIELPTTITSIGMDAFNGCPDLQRVHCHALVPPTLSEGAFDGSAANMRICVPDSMVDTYRSADGWINYKIHIVGDSSAAAKSFEDIETVATPEISLNEHIVTITCATEGATIRYATDGMLPDGNSTLYTKPFTLLHNCTVIARAYKDDCYDSQIASIECTDFKAETPVITYEDGKAVITSSQKGATIHYTLDGTTPTVNNTIYAEPIVPDRNMTIKAIAAMDNVTDSEVTSYKVEDFSVAEPVITCNDEGIISMTTSTTGARIYYTLDGSTPRKGSTLYAEPFAATGNDLIKAVGTKSDYNNSGITTYQINYFIAKQPEISVLEEEGLARVSISCDTKDATIRYTLDGTDPTNSSDRYSGAFTLGENTIIKAMASATDLLDSPIACDTIDFFSVSTPVIDTAGLQLSITCSTESSTVYYTLDGTKPSAGSNKYTSPVTLQRNCQIQAIALRQNFNDSEIASIDINTFKAQAPDIQYLEGSVTIECSTEGAIIHYTTDGSQPTAESAIYSDAFSVSTGMVIKAYAVADGFNGSDVSSITVYNKSCGMPAVQYDGKTFWFDGLESGTTVYYTLDGSYPTSSSKVYTGQKVVMEDFCTIRAIATAANMNNSMPSSLTPRALFKTSDMTAYVKEAGALKEAFSWCTETLSDTIISINGSINGADISFIRTADVFEELDFTKATFPDNQLPDSAFYGSSLVSVTLPAEITSVGAATLGACGNLAAILWTAETQMPAELMQGVSNPNLLVYVDSQEQAPEGWGNVVVGDHADVITLTSVSGPGNFHAPKAFTASTVSFTRTFTQESGFEESAGWESLSLPFAVQTIQHESKGGITPFGAEGNLHFWLYMLQSSGFSETQKIQAYTPYLICLPHNSRYAAATDLSGTLTFSATDAYIEASYLQNYTGLRKGNLIFRPNFRRQSSDETILVLNTYQIYEGNLPGSVFVSSLRNVEPFEAFLRSVSLQDAPAVYHIGSGVTGLDQTGISADYTVQTIRGGVRIRASADVEVPVYTLTGQRIGLVVLTAGDEEELPLAPGIYLIGTQKVVVGK